MAAPLFLAFSMLTLKETAVVINPSSNNYFSYADVILYNVNNNYMTNNSWYLNNNDNGSYDWDLKLKLFSSYYVYFIQQLIAADTDNYIIFYSHCVSEYVPKDFLYIYQYVLCQIINHNRSVHHQNFILSHFVNLIILSIQNQCMCIVVSSLSDIIIYHTYPYMLCDVFIQKILIITNSLNHHQIISMLNNKQYKDDVD